MNLLRGQASANLCQTVQLLPPEVILLFILLPMVIAKRIVCLDGLNGCLYRMSERICLSWGLSVHGFKRNAGPLYSLFVRTPQSGPMEYDLVTLPSTVIGYIQRHASLLCFSFHHLSFAAIPHNVCHFSFPWDHIIIIGPEIISLTLHLQVVFV